MSNSANEKILRNCDVGTVEERKERFSKFCQGNMPCRTCRFREEHFLGCILNWEDLPYNGESKKDSTR